MNLAYGYILWKKKKYIYIRASVIAFENDVNVIQLCNKLREFNGVIHLRATQFRIPITFYRATSN